MISTITRLIDRAVIIPGYTNRVAYDSDHSESFGYWLCKACRVGFYGGGEDHHRSECEYKRRRKWLYDYKDECLIYVLGPKETGLLAPFERSQIQAIKEIAKKQLNLKINQENDSI